MPAYNPARVVGPLALTTSAADLYTASPNQVLLRQLMLSNTTSGTVTVRLNLVPVGGSAAASNQVVPDYVIVGHDITYFDTWLIMNPGDKINGFATTGAAVNVIWSGVLL